jgi:two-component system chemotaxis response regulator CheB
MLALSGIRKLYSHANPPRRLDLASTGLLGVRVTRLEAFTRQFTERLNSLCKIRVKEAQDGDRILPGHALLAPGGHHMAVARRGAEYAVHVYRGERVNRHLPSVDVLFSSCARSMGKNALGALLTGMGADGAKGMLEMKQAGAFNIAQDESTSVVFGMPREAILLNVVDRVLPLDQIPRALLERLAVA